MGNLGDQRTAKETELNSSLGQYTQVKKEWNFGTTGPEPSMASMMLRPCLAEPECKILYWLVFNMQILRVDAQGVRHCFVYTVPSASFASELQKQHSVCERNAPSPCRFGTWWLLGSMAGNSAHDHGKESPEEN